ncbi:MAG TPA: malate dehydrogenase, partial [Trueperaceae bacterium]
TIWGNHSSTQVPDLSHATVGGKPAADLVDEAWVVDHFIPTVQKRGAAIIDARGASSAASAANAAIDHVRSWALGTPDGDWVSMGISSKEAGNAYGVEGDVIYSYPVTINGGEVSVVEDLQLGDEVRTRMKASEAELLEERAAVADLLG